VKTLYQRGLRGLTTWCKRRLAGLGWSKTGPRPRYSPQVDVLESRMLPSSVFMFSQSNYVVEFGNVGTGTASAYVEIDVQRFGDLTNSATVDYSTNADTAVAGTDFTAVNGTLTFDAYATDESFDVPVQANFESFGGSTPTLRYFGVTLEYPSCSPTNTLDATLDNASVTIVEPCGV
jgi:hypothetical protein